MLLLLLACKQPITVVSYNAGLAVGFVPGADDRAEAALGAVQDLDADITCLQEVWLPEHVALLDAEHSVIPEPQQEIDPAPACEDGELDTFLECIDENCPTDCADDLVTCVFESCVFPFLGLDKTCQGCVMANVGGDVSDVTDACLQEDTRYAYGGSFGTALLSKWPILEQDELVFESTTNRRGVNHALIDSPMGEVDVYCTHLTAIFTLIPYPREEGSWDEEQRVQIDAMRDWIDQTATAKTALLIGDTNNGPDFEDQNYDRLAEGWQVPYVDADLPCTYCEANGLNSESSEDRVIDHVMLQGFRGEASAERVLDQDIEVVSCGNALTGGLSDHYGVSVTLDP